MKIGARDSPLSKAQVEEVRREMPDLLFESVWVKTKGDRDQATSLRHLEKTDFFTYELDQMLLQGDIDLAIHSAKDLPDPLPQGISCIAMTRCIDSRDALVFRPGETLHTLPSQSSVATSSERREEAVKALRSDLRFVDVRGNIGERLKKLETKEVDAVVVAEAALIRLGLTCLNRLFLPQETAPLQGRLALLARTEDAKIRSLIEPIFKKILYLGLTPTHWPLSSYLVHYPVIRTEMLHTRELKRALLLWPQFTHVLFTSQSAVRYWWEVSCIPFDKQAIAIGRTTAEQLLSRDVRFLLAPEATQEGVIALLETLDLKNAFLFLPRSRKSRPLLSDYLKRKKIPFFSLDLYDTVSQKSEPIPSLESIGEIIFTSPSTAQGFLDIFGHFPKDKRLTPIGPITEQFLHHLTSMVKFPLWFVKGEPPSVEKSPMYSPERVKQR